MTSLEGQKFHDYEVLTLLGQGSVGAVYKAHQLSLDRLVSLKVLLPGLSRDREFITRFKQDAIAAAKLNHPNLVQMYSAGESDGLFYLSMEFIEGDSLQQRLDRAGRLDVEQALATCYYLAHALNHGWRRAGLIHRSVKPSNIYLSRHGEVKLGDLGVARPAGTAFVVGKPHYISPEQALGETDVDRRSDIYSLGCVLYHMLAGRPPYDGPTAKIVMSKHVNEPSPMITKVWPECPAQVALLLNKMLAKDPSARPQDYAELIADLVRVSEQLGLAAAGSTERVAPKTTPPMKPATAKMPVSAPTQSSSAMFVAATVVIVATVVAMVWAPWKTREAPKAEPLQQVDNEDAKTRSRPVKIETEPPKQLPPPAPAPQPPITSHEPPITSKPASAAATLIAGAWSASVASLPAEEQVQRIVARLQELNPGYDGKERHKITDGRVTELTLPSEAIKDLSPVRALTGLQKLSCGTTRAKGALSDLSPLRGMALTHLWCINTHVADLTALKGMPLEYLSLVANPINDLQPLAGTPLVRLFLANTQVSSLAPLKGMSLTDLYVEGTRVDDLSPLQGMPLERLSLTQTPVADLTPVQNAPLTFLNITGTAVKDLAPLAKMPLRYLNCEMATAENKRAVQTLMAISTLQKINGKSVNDFIQAVNVAVASMPRLDQPAQAAPPEQPSDPFVIAVAAMPAEQQVAAVVARLRERNPRFDGREQHRVAGNVVTELNISAAAITDISPVRALLKLQRLTLTPWTGQTRGALADLSPLKGMQLVGLGCHNTQVDDLSPLRDMPLTAMTCDNTAVSDLSPLKGMRLTVLSCSYTGVSDLAPLDGMPLTVLWCNDAKITDLSPLQGMPLKELRCDFVKERDAIILDRIATLERINNMPAASFWTKVGPIVLKSGGKR